MQPVDWEDPLLIEARLRRLEDREAKRKLRASYCYRIDDRDWEDFAAPFTRNAHLDWGWIGSFDGRAEVRRLPRMSLARDTPPRTHDLRPVIEVDGDEATGRWYFEVPCTFSDGSVGWIQGTYLDEYRRVEYEWHFSTVTAELNYIAYYESKWAEAVAKG